MRDVIAELVEYEGCVAPHVITDESGDAGEQSVQACLIGLVNALSNTR